MVVGFFSRKAYGLPPLQNATRLAGASSARSDAFFVSKGITAFEEPLSRRSLLSRVKSLDPVRRNVYLLLAAFWLAALGLAWAGYAYYWNQRNAIEAEERSRLEAIAELKVRQIREWRNERLADARILEASPISPPVRRFLAGHATAADEAEIAIWLDAIRSASGYSNVILIKIGRAHV